MADWGKSKCHIGWHMRRNERNELTIKFEQSSVRNMLSPGVSKDLELEIRAKLMWRSFLSQVAQSTLVES